MVHKLEVILHPMLCWIRRGASYASRNESAGGSEATLVDDHLRQHYQYTRSFGSLSIWQRIPRLLDGADTRAE
jgi:hypothetical protein